MASAAPAASPSRSAAQLTAISREQNLSVCSGSRSQRPGGPWGSRAARRRAVPARAARAAHGG
eukprot:2521119-Prymnesium_polylepis.1